MDVWEKHFISVLQSKETRRKKSTDQIKAKKTDLFKTEEVERIVKQCKEKKASGPDGIFYEHVKASWPILGSLITSLLNQCILQGTIPERWREATLKILYKGKGDSGDPNSYRGIALECVLLKVLTKLIASRLLTATNDRIPDEQFGFRPGRSTLQAVQCLHEDIMEAIKFPRGKMYAVFIDFKKAFDSINRSQILDKLHVIGARPYITTLIGDILAKRTT